MHVWWMVTSLMSSCYTEGIEESSDESTSEGAIAPMDDTFVEILETFLNDVEGQYSLSGECQVVLFL